MKHINVYLGVGFVLLVPLVLFAQTTDSGVLQKLVNIEDESRLLETISLWSALIVALLTSIMVWLGGRRMHGGIFGSALTFFSIGMSLIFLSAATEISWFQQFPHLYIKMTHDTLFIIGYVFMAIAANKLLNVIKG